MSEHATKIGYEKAPVRHGPYRHSYHPEPRYRASCTCGWRAPARTQRAIAESDATGHIDANF